MENQRGRGSQLRRSRSEEATCYANARKTNTDGAEWPHPHPASPSKMSEKWGEMVNCDSSSIKSYRYFSQSISFLTWVSVKLQCWLGLVEAIIYKLQTVASQQLFQHLLLPVKEIYAKPQEPRGVNQRNLLVRASPSIRVTSA